jgi:hypothetical protein
LVFIALYMIMVGFPPPLPCVELTTVPVKVCLGKLRVRYSVHRFVFFILLLASVAGFGQSSAQKPEKPAQAVATAQPVSDEVAQAEAAVVKSDWKTAEARLDTWLAAHPSDTWPMHKIGWRRQQGSINGR